MSNEIPAVHTSVTAEDMLTAFRACLPDMLDNGICCLMAQWALETGRGKSMICNNVGNIRWFPSDTAHNYCVIQTWEMVNGQRQNMLGNFRVYPNLASGMGDYVALLRKRFNLSWPAVENGDPDLFAKRLYEQHYFTAPVADYARGLRSLWGEYMKVAAATPRTVAALCSSQSSTPDPGSTSSDT